MPISFARPLCQTNMKAPDAAAGRSATCIACRETITVPLTSAALPPVALEADDEPPAVAKSPRGAIDVRVLDVEIPFLSMVALMVKWALAAIPAMFILITIWFTAGAIFMGLVRARMGF